MERSVNAPDQTSRPVRLSKAYSVSSPPPANTNPPLVTIAPGAGQFWANYANVLMDLDQVEEADAAAQTAVDLSPNYAVAHNNLGTVRQRRGQYAEAEDHFWRALGLNDDYADAHANMAEVLKDTVVFSLAHSAARRQSSETVEMSGASTAFMPTTW